MVLHKTHFGVFHFLRDGPAYNQKWLCRTVLHITSP